MIRQLILLFLAGFSFLALHAQDTSRLDIHDNGDYSTFSMLDDVVGKYRIIFTGENHLFRKSNYRLELKMMKYLYYKADFRHFFMEFGYSRGWLVDKYVQTGDTTLFKVLSDYSYEEYALLYKGLYEFNKTLPEGKKIRIHSIDIERSLSTPVKVLDMMIPKDKPVPAAIALTVESIHALAVMSDTEQRRTQQSKKEEFRLGSPFSLKRSLKFILDDLDSNRSVFKEFIGEAYDEFYLIETGLRAEVERSRFNDANAVHGYIYRERFMHESLRQLAQKYPDGKFYGQFGRCHTSLDPEDVWCGFYAFKTLATRLDTDTLFLGKVLAIAQYYPNGSTHEKGVILRDGVSPVVEVAAKEGLTLIKHSSSLPDTAKLKDRFQYLIINQSDHRTDNLKADSTKASKNDTYSYESTPFFEGHYGLLGVSLNGLNQHLFSDNGLELAFQSPLVVAGGSFTQQEEGAYVSMMYSSILSNELNLGDTLVYALKGGSFRFRAGADLFSSEWVDFGPFFGYGFQRLVLTRDAYQENGSDNSFFGNAGRIRSQVTNPSFFFDAGVVFRARIKFFYIGGSAAWQLDASKRGWREDGKYLDAGPRTSQSGMVLLGQAGFFF